PCCNPAPRPGGSRALPSRAGQRRRSRRSSPRRRDAPGSPRAAADRRGERTPSADLHRAAPRYPPRRGRPRRSPRRGARLRLGLGLRGRLGLRSGFTRRRLGGLRSDPRRLRGSLLATVRGPVRGAADEHAVEPLGGLLLVHVLGVHELAGQDLLGLDEHLLLPGGETLLAVPKREVPDDLGELEDVAGLHLVAVVLEAAVPVL